MNVMKITFFLFMAVLSFGLTLEDIENRWAGLEGLEGEFTQHEQTPLGVQEQEGSIIMHRPDILLRTGEQNMFFSSDSLYIWSSGEDEGMVIPSPPIFSKEIFTMLRQSHDISLEGNTVTARAKEDAAILSFEIIIDEKTLLPQSIELNRIDGTTSVISVKSLIESKPPNPVLPEGVDFIGY